MPIFKLRERVLRLESGPEPRFPCNVELSVMLQPAVPFGGVPGPSRSAVTDTTFNARANLSTARFTIEYVEPPFDQLDESDEYEGGIFTIRGNVATVSTECQTEAELHKLIDSLLFTFPGVLSQRLPDVPYIEYAWGRLDGRPFRIEYEPTDVLGSATVTTRAGQGQAVVESWQRTLALHDQPRLSLGCQYFQIAVRLLEVGQNRFEFTAEAILNFAKCLQALCGDSRDAARSNLRKLGYNSSDLDGRFIPAMVLRDQFDVAHIALSRLNREQLRVLHDYADIAESAFRELLGRVLEAVAEDQYELPEGEIGAVSSEKRRVLSRLADGIRPHIRG